MIVDAHQHFWTADYAWLADPSLEPIRRDYGVDDLLPHLAASGVDASILVEGGRCESAETAWFLSLAAATPAIAGVVGWASLSDLSDISALPDSEWLVGIRDQVQAGPDDLLDHLHPGLATVAAAGLVNELVVRTPQLPSVARAAAALTDARFVLDHLGKPPIADPDGLAVWRSMIAPIAECPNVTAKLSGLVTEAGPDWTADALRPWVQTALELFGPDRLMFGSDWPVCELVATYEQVIDALTEILGGRPAAVFGDTATRVYGLEPL
ncbi:amidohydrolase family protein [Actinoplanes rectilineatus]|uniref:amidohydrolase family protein n=1 Tax=Actinoplanes rectilineatus TaxID=113571 RepID=UPI0005F282EB|nr:amidohydrolase family protein [Actinoplanes rectilineatus]